MREEGSRPLTGFIIRRRSGLRSSQYQAFFSSNIKFCTLQKQSDRNTCWGGKTIYKDTRIDSLFFFCLEIFFSQTHQQLFGCVHILATDKPTHTHTRTQPHGSPSCNPAGPFGSKHTRARDVSTLYVLSAVSLTAPNGQREN